MKRDRGLWVLLTFVPLGWATWGAFLTAGTKAGVRRWQLYAPVYVGVAVLPWALDAAIAGDDGDAAAGFALFGGWLFGIVHAFIARTKYLQIVGSAMQTSRDAAEKRLHERREALEIAQRDPALAREMGIGTPNGPGGLVDVNGAPLDQLERLPGIDAATAARILEVRGRVGEFSSLADLGMTAELDPAVVEDLRGRVVFL
jgi:helix-hairpin-helix protein